MTTSWPNTKACVLGAFWGELFKRNTVYTQYLILLYRALLRYTTNFGGIYFHISTVTRKDSKGSWRFFIPSSANKVSLCFLLPNYSCPNYRARASQPHLLRNPWVISPEVNTQLETSWIHIFVKSHFGEKWWSDIHRWEANVWYCEERLCNQLLNLWEDSQDNHLFFNSF